jgi:hypothetical protein
MLKFLLGAAVGYVLGAKAGHRRYTEVTPADRHGREARCWNLLAFGGTRCWTLLETIDSPASLGHRAFTPPGL